MTAHATIDEVIELMETVGLKLYLSHTVGKHTVYVLVNPQTLFTLHAWQENEGVSGSFVKETEKYLQEIAFKRYLNQDARMAEAQRKARDLFLEFTGGTDV